MPLLWISTAFLCGIFVGWLFGGRLPVWLTAIELTAFVLSICSYIIIRKTKFHFPGQMWLVKHWPLDHETLLPGFVLPLIPLMALFGGMQYRASLPILSDEFIAWYNDRPEQITVQGIIADDPEYRDFYTLIKLDAESIKLAGLDIKKEVHGRVQVWLPQGGDWRYGDRVLLAGFLRSPTDLENDSYKNYLAHHGMYSTLSCTACLPCIGSRLKSCFQLLDRYQGNRLKGAIFAARQKALSAVFALYPNPEAGLLAGILLGIETRISPHILEAFRLTGTSHIIAISGFNFAIISGLLVWFFSHLLGRWRSLPAAWIGIGAYAVLAGASAGVIRAAIMGSFAIFAVRIGRRSSGLNMLAFVAALMVLAAPHILWDVSFQLSFMATLGLVLYAEPLEKGFARLVRRWIEPEHAFQLSQPVAEYFLFTLAAQVTTLPLILFYFRRVSLISLAANPLILPVQPPLMIIGGISAVSALFIPLFGKVLAIFAWPWVAYTIRVVETMAGAARAGITVEAASLWWVVGFYALLFSITLFGSRLKGLFNRIAGENFSRLGWVLTIGIALLAIVGWQRVATLPDGKLHLTVLDVGDGDAILIKSPSGRTVLVNGGPSPSLLSEAIGRRLPFGRSEIDFLIIAGVGDDQIASLPRALDHFKVRNVLWAGPLDGTYNERELQKRLMQNRVPITEAQSGHVFDLGDGVRLVVISVSARGAILLLEWDRFRALLPVGLDFESQGALMKDTRFAPVTALMLAESGLASLNTSEWIAHWQPRLALLSVAAGNEEGLPHPETLEALDGVPLLRTDQNGWIELSTDGERLLLEVEKK